MSEPWTCPFCALLCDRYTVAHAVPPTLVGSDCPRAHAYLQHFDLSTPPDAAPLVGGAPASLDAALDAAAERLRAARQPLVGGLATDVAGMRALYRLAAACGAIVDHAHGEAMQPGLRTLQDRGQFTCTLAEIAERAELIVCVGALPGEAYPEFWRRVVRDAHDTPLRKVVFVGTPVDARLQARGLAAEAIDLDIVDALPQLNALVAGRPMRTPPPALAALADALRASRYSVLVYESSRLPRHGALVVEQAQRLVGELNKTTRAATFSLGGSDGAATAQQVVTWLSGLPLRSRIARTGLDHQPLRFAAPRLLADRAVDALLWVGSFGPQLPCPEAPMPRIVLGHPALAAHATDVFIPVSTPGVGSDGHLFRTDSSVALPLPRLVDDGLPTVAQVADALAERLA